MDDMTTPTNAATPEQTPLDAAVAGEVIRTPAQTLAKERRERQDRTTAKLREEDLLEVICENVACGGSVVDLCEVWDVRYDVIVRWVYDAKHPERKTAYEEALGHRSEWMKSRLLGELKSIGLADIRRAYDSNGNLLDVSQMPADLARVIAAVEVTEEFEGRGDSKEKIGYTKKIKLWDRLRALELLGKNMSMFREVVDHRHTGMTLEDLVAGSNAPALPAPKPVAEMEKILQEPMAVNEEAVKAADAKTDIKELEI